MYQIVSFVIPTLNEEKYLPFCLKSISNLRKPPEICDIEIIVVDNGSTDNTAEISKRYNANFISIPPKTISASRNRGAFEAKGELIAFIDADCELDPNWLFLSIEQLSKSGIVGYGTTASPPGDDASWVEKNWYQLRYKDIKKGVFEKDWLPTFNLLVSKKYFLMVGGFNEELVTCEDSDLGYKLSQKGRLILDTRIDTRHFRNSTTLREFFRREAWRGRGNIPGFFKHSFNSAELPSLLFPIVYLVSVFLGPIFLLTGVLLNSCGMQWFMGSLLIAFFLPFVFIGKKRFYLNSVNTWIPCYILANVYLFARGIASFYSPSR